MKEGGACCSAYAEGMVLAQGQQESFFFPKELAPSHPGTPS